MTVPSLLQPYMSVFEDVLALEPDQSPRCHYQGFTGLCPNPNPQPHPHPSPTPLLSATGQSSAQGRAWCCWPHGHTITEIEKLA